MAVGALGALAIAGGSTLFGMLMGSGPIGEARDNMLNKLFAVTRTPIEAIIRLRLWQVKDDDWFYDKMRAYGYGKEVADETLKSYRTWQDMSSIIRWGWRNDKPDSEVAEILVAHGWEAQEAKRMVEVAHFYPSPADLVNWQAKEVFEPEMIKHYGLDAELGELDLSMFKRAGMTEEQARNYWIAHWEHPSWNQLQEMLFRIPDVTEEEVRRWFKLMEVPPFWRQHMIDTAYHPYTRVDVRRMHKIGVFGTGEDADAKLRTAYTDLGFHGEQADNMVLFTKKYNMQSGESASRDLTRSMIERAYDIGYIQRDTAHDYLSGMGYDEDEVTFIIGSLDADRALSSGGDWLTLLKNQLTSGLRTRSEVEQKLADLGFDGQAVSHYADLFEAWAEEPTKTPSKTDVKSWLAHGVITEAAARGYLGNLGYTTGHIEMYIVDWAGGPDRYEEWRKKQIEIEKRLKG